MTSTNFGLINGAVCKTECVDERIYTELNMSEIWTYAYWFNNLACFKTGSGKYISLEIDNSRVYLCEGDKVHVDIRISMYREDGKLKVEEEYCSRYFNFKETH